MIAVAKACPLVLRRDRGCNEVLVFRHPLAGVQLVKGSVEPDEEVREAARRELSEEAGLDALALIADLGVSAAIAPDQHWHFFVFDGDGLPGEWIHRCADDGGHDFAFFWHPLDDDPDAQWRAIFVAALMHVRRTLT